MSTLKILVIIGLILIALFGYKIFPTIINKIVNNKLALILIFGVGIYIGLSDKILGAVLIAVLLYLLLIDAKVMDDMISGKLDKIYSIAQNTNVNTTEIKDDVISTTKDVTENITNAVTTSVKKTYGSIADFFKEHDINVDVENFMIPKNGKYVFPYDGKMKELELDDENMSNL